MEDVQYSLTVKVASAKGTVKRDVWQHMKPLMMGFNGKYIFTIIELVRTMIYHFNGKYTFTTIELMNHFLPF